jgi:Domain of unknown function (DUF4177)
MFEYKIHTQRDKTFLRRIRPTEFEAALNAHAADGWRLAEIHGLQPLEEHDA